jgi:FtsP/CotA-like multicopper oxidase with cupredoxin domain
MHAHTLQEQHLLAAPLIVRDREGARRDEQEVVLLLHDFSFTPAEELLARLTRSTAGHGMHGMGGMGAMHLNDIEYDAYLANDRTLDDPEIVKVESGGRIRLRIINAAAATVFTIDTGEIDAELMAVDGKDVEPLRGRRFPVAMGQRVDLRLELPKDTKPWPILALREDSLERTGLILAPPGARITKLVGVGSVKTTAMGFELESRLKAKTALAARPVDRTIPIMLGGGMHGYEWGIMSADGLSVRKGERVRIVMQNHSMMAHPMHLHGHHFQVIAINGRTISGAVRDTVHVPPMTSVAIAFDADHPGKWAFHCHHLYHMASGMMSMLNYEDVA